jgi:hypothetical protein
VSRWDVERVISYLKRQKDHDCSEDLFPEWEETFVEVSDDKRSNETWT